MALSISTYTDPGVYIGEVVVPGSANISSVPLTVTLIGIASRNKRVNNEALTRGLVSNESLTVGATPGAHDATLIDVSNRKSAQLTVFQDGTALDSAQVSFLAPTKAGNTLTTLDFTAPNNKIALSLDGKTDVTIAIIGGGSDVTTIAGSLITQQLTSIGGGIAVTTPVQIAEAINKALAGASSLGYGSAYGAVATTSAGKVIVTSPLGTSAADLRLFSAFPSAQSKTIAVFGGSTPFQAPTVIRIADASYSGTSLYTADYVATNTDVDVLANSNVQSMIRVGSFAGVSSFIEATDFSRSGSNLDWSVDAAALFTSSIASATKDISTNDSFLLSLDGRAAITIDLNGLGSPPPGYANPASPAAATNAEIVANINAILANSPTYGPRYQFVAGVSSLQLTLTSPNQGVGSFVELASTPTLSAVLALFGLSSSQLPYSTSGTGSRPLSGSIYFASYEFTRPSLDYNLPKRYFTPDAAYSDVGFPTSTNQLAIATGISFENNAPSVIVVQVDDANFPGNPTQTELLTALNSTNETSATTELCMLTTALASQVDLLNNVVNQNSPTQKNARRGWFGMARNTLVGDKDTPNTYIYRAVRTLQVPGDSPGRGRMILAAPANVSRDITREDGVVSNVKLHGAYVAAAIAAKMTSFNSPSDTLLRKSISGFKLDDFQAFLKAERGLLASNGVTVVTNDAGNLKLLDPISTEAGNGKLASFQEISASTQKDSVTAGVESALDANLVGVVPSDLAQFILTIKGFIGGVLRAAIAQGACAPYKTENGVTRDIDFAKDIQVFQDPTDPTKYQFRYFFNLRYPAKRFFGQYSVDNPFFGG